MMTRSHADCLHRRVRDGVDPSIKIICDDRHWIVEKCTFSSQSAILEKLCDDDNLVSSLEDLV